MNFHKNINIYLLGSLLFLLSCEEQEIPFADTEIQSIDIHFDEITEDGLYHISIPKEAKDRLTLTLGSNP